MTESGHVLAEARATLSGMDEIRIEPLTPDRFPALAALFTEGGDPRWCWCTYWRVRGTSWRVARLEDNREHLRSLVEAAAASTSGRQPPGLVAFDGERAIGWVSLGPREDFERLERSRVRPRLDDTPVWSIVCFVVSRTARRSGLSRRLLEAAIDHARRNGAPALEAYPVATGGTKVPAANLYTGSLSTFLAAGFTVAREIDSPQATVRRVIVRRAL